MNNEINEEVVNTTVINQRKRKNSIIKIALIILAIAVLVVIGVVMYNYFTTKDGSAFRITRGGTYDITGDYGCISVNTSKEVTLNLENAKITCETGPAINVIKAKSANIILSGNSILVSKTKEELDGAIYSNAALVLSGNGRLTLTSNLDGIVSKKAINIKGGQYIISAQDDGIRGKDNVVIDNGVFTINASGDGIKSTNDKDSKLGYIEIKGGVFDITTLSDGIQTETYLSISGGVYNIKTGEGYNSNIDNNGDSDGLKANGDIVLKDSVFTFNTAGDAVHSDSAIEINNGMLTIATGDDAVRASATLTITSGDIIISNCYEGLESNIISIRDGNISINALNDGINAVGTTKNKSDGKVLISGGTLNIISEGDSIDSNGTIEITNGIIYAESLNTGGETAIDHDGALIVSGGTIIAVSKSEGSPAIGPRSSTQPMLIATLSGESGKITLGDVSYEPSIDEYRQVIISSPELNEGRYVFKYGKHSQNVTLTNDITTIGEPNIEWEEVGRIKN